MSAPERDPVSSLETAAADTLGQKAVRVMEDPFGSMVAGLIAPAAAVGAVVSGILGLAVIY